MVICYAEWLSATRNEGEFPPRRKFSFLIKKRGSLIKLFKVCGFLRQSLKSRSAEREKSLALQAVAVLGDSLEGKNLPQRDIFSFTPPPVNRKGNYSARTSLLSFSNIVLTYDMFLLKQNAIQYGQSSARYRAELCFYLLKNLFLFLK